VNLYYRERIEKNIKISAKKATENPINKTISINNEGGSPTPTPLESARQSHQGEWIASNKSSTVIRDDPNPLPGKTITPDILATLIDNIGKAEVNPNNTNNNQNQNQNHSPTHNHLHHQHHLEGSQHHGQSFSSYQSSGIVPTTSMRKTLKESDKDELWSIIKTIKIPAYSVFITFAGTLLVYPSTMVLIQSESACHSKYNSLFISILFTLYNLGDFLGRSRAIQLHAWEGLSQYINERNIWIYTNLRLIIPLLICFCNISNSRLPILFPFDVITIFLFLSLGLTNGFFANLAMMYGPSMVESEKSALAGTIMIFCLSSGLFVGACFSFLVVFILVG
jgi:hypothetical protein